MAASRADVWITGASRGIGAALAREYAATGARLTLTARPSDELDHLAATVGNDALALPADLTDRAAIGKLVGALQARERLPDLAILNAGTYAPAGLDDWHGEDVRALFALNVFAVADVFELLVPLLRQRGRGHVAVVGSVAGDTGLPYAGAYSASKAAVNRMCESLRPEFERAGLRLSVISPGFVATPLTAQNDFPMPFLITADAAAHIIRRGLDRGRTNIRFPLRMSLLMRALAASPECVRGAITRRMLRA